MKKNLQRFFLVIILAFVLVMPLVSAAGESTIEKGRQVISQTSWGNQPVDESSWYGWLISNILGVNANWMLVIACLLVMIMLVAGIYDILAGFSLFKKGWVQFTIALGIGILAGLSGAIQVIALFFFGIGAGLGAAAVLVGIAIPLIIFVIMNFLFFKIFKNLAVKKTNAEIDAGAKEAAAAAEGLGSIAKGFRKARQEAEKD